MTKSKAKAKRPARGARGPKSDALVLAEVMDVALEAEALHSDNLRRERLLLDKRDELVRMLPNAEAQKALVVLNGHIKQQQGNNTTRMLVFARTKPAARGTQPAVSVGLLGRPDKP